MHNSKKIAVIGAGIVGLAHALEAAKKGCEVTVFEKNTQAFGASIRNFGLVWPIGQPEGTLYERALRSRSVWTEVCQDANIWIKENGSLQLAHFPDEMAVLEEFADTTTSYSAELMDQHTIEKKYPHLKRSNLIGGMYSTTECTVNPREAIQKLPGYLSEKYKVNFHFNTLVKGINDNTLVTTKGYHAFDHIFLCSGQDFQTLFPDVFGGQEITNCKLQMMRSVSLPDFDLGPSLSAGLTLRHYDSFRHCESLQAVSDRYDQSNPEFKTHGIHVLVSQNNHMELVIGDSHEYASDFDPFESEEINQHILNYLNNFISIDELNIKERWHGIYPKPTNGKTELIVEKGPVTIVNGLGGAGMTLSFGLAQEVVGTSLSIAQMH